MCTVESVTDPSCFRDSIGYFLCTMLRPSRSTLLTLSLAFPAASWGLGLGDIHVRSALDQPLEAQIELIGATPDDIAIVTARILNESEFRQHGLEWFSFLSGSTLTVGKDDQGTPTLIVHSIDKVTEPIVTLLVGVDSPSGQLVREYTLLLDPVDRAPQPRTADAGSTTPSVTADTSSPAPAVSQMSPARAERARANAASANNPPEPAQTPRSQLYTVAAHDTLDGIARSAAGAVSKSELRRMEIAIYHANPDAFRANLNLLRRGATLRLPSAEELAAISAQDAAREYTAQMQAWRPGGRRTASAAPQTAPGTSSAALASTPPSGESEETQVRQLTEQVQSLETTLHELQQELKQPVVIPAPAPVVASSTRASAPARSPAVMATQQARPARVGGTNARPQRRPSGSPPAPFAALVVCGALVLFAGIWLWRRRQNTGMPSKESDTARGSDRVAGTDQSKTDDGPPSLQTTASSATASSRDSHGDTRADGSAALPASEANWFNRSSRNPVNDLSDKKAAPNRPEPNYAAPDATLKLSKPLAAHTLENATMKLSKPLAGNAAETATVKVSTPLAGNAAETATVKVSTPIAGNTVETAVVLGDVETSDETEKFSFFDEKNIEDTTHVVMGSGLTESTRFVERRKNPADVLRQAIEREPNRNDLRLKLLELYYTGAAQNRRAFLEAVRELAKNQSLVSPEDWSRIMDMGKTIAPEDEQFNDDTGSKEVA